MSLLERDDQQPSTLVKSLRYIRYNIEDILIAGVMCLEVLCIYWNLVPIKLVLTWSLLAVIVIILLGGI